MVINKEVIIIDINNDTLSLVLYVCSNGDIFHIHASFISLSKISCSATDNNMHKGDLTKNNKLFNNLDNQSCFPTKTPKWHCLQ